MRSWKRSSPPRDVNPVARHRWIEVAPAGRDAVAATAAPTHRDTVRRWLECGLPLVARSRQPEDVGEGQPAGLVLPTASGKVKVSLRVAPSHIARIDEPPPLDALAAILPGEASRVAIELAAHARTLGFTARAFGSAAWQWRTGQGYLHERSDLDLLAAPPTAIALHAWIERLGSLEPRMPMRLDGEIEWAGGDAVNWRELAGTSERLLVKSPAGARLAERAVLEQAWR